MDEQLKALAQRRRSVKAPIYYFIRQHWTDQKLFDVYCFNRDDKMNYNDPCSCIRGVTLSDTLHTQRQACPGDHRFRSSHYELSRLLEGAELAEWAYGRLGSFAFGDSHTHLWSHDFRRARFSALLRAEMRRRLRKQLTGTADLPALQLAEDR